MLTMAKRQGIDCMENIIAIQKINADKRKRNLKREVPLKEEREEGRKKTRDNNREIVHQEKKAKQDEVQVLPPRELIKRN